MHGILRFITQRRNLIFVILASIVAVVLAFYVAKFLGSVTSVPTTPAASGDPPSGWRDIPFKDLLQIVIIPIFLAYLSWYLGTKDRDARHGPIPIVPGEKKNTILMLGLGRTGKTTIVNTLAGKKISGTEEQTEKFQIYQYFVRNPKKWILDKGSESDSQNISEKPVSFYIPDYRGQDLSKMIRGFLVEQTKANTPLRYGDINTLMLVVDIVPEKLSKNGKGAHSEVSEPDVKRIEAHLHQWSVTALDAIFGLLVEETLQTIILVVNKCDLLVNGVPRQRPWDRIG